MVLNNDILNIMVILVIVDSARDVGGDCPLTRAAA